MKRSEINIRDPFILPVEPEKLYYMYCSTPVPPKVSAPALVVPVAVPGVTEAIPAAVPETVPAPVEVVSAAPAVKPGFSCYTSTDLEEWSGPVSVFEKPDNFWADRDFWAPEVHFYEGKYYMFASFKSATRSRGTQILVSDYPKGPFVPLSEFPITPDTWECLDGTLYIDPSNDPWIVFCREWVQVKDGEVCAMKLSKNLMEKAAEPIFLFNASEADWSADLKGKPRGHFITDGPFMHRSADGTLLMVWSSFNRFGKYATGVARSMTGTIEGPWVQHNRAIYFEDGGHGMLFKTFEGKMMLVMHSPNISPRERSLMIEVKEDGNTLRQVR